MAAPSRQILMPNDAIGLSLFYALMLSPRGIKMPPHLKPVCAAVTDQRIRKLMILIGPGSGKSLLLSTVYPAFALGQDPAMTILGLSAGEALMQGFQKAVMEWVEHSKEYHMAFPGIVPDKDSGWSTERGMYVKGRLPGDPDASYFAAGLTSSALTGKHARLVICDDLHNKENAATSETCQKVIDTYYNTILGRADPRGARFIIAGRRWRDDDIYAHLMKEDDFVVMSLPAEREGTSDLWWDIQVPEGLDCVFTDAAAAMLMPT